MNERDYLSDKEMELDEETRHILITDFKMTEAELAEHVQLDHRSFLEDGLRNEAKHHHDRGGTACDWVGIHAYCHGVDEALSSSWTRFLRDL